jgi:hypothetical protein
MNLTEFCRSENQNGRHANLSLPFGYILITTGDRRHKIVEVNRFVSSSACGLRFVSDANHSCIKVGKAHLHDDEVLKHGLELRFNNESMCIDDRGRLLDSDALLDEPAMKLRAFASRKNARARIAVENTGFGILSP